MNQNNNLQKLETAIRTALPELMELTEGCDVMTGGKIFTIGKDAKVVWPNKKEIEINGKWLNTFLIVGKPVTLLHLLRWLDKLDRIYRMDADGELNDVTWFNNKNFGFLDLSKTLLRDQSKEVID